MRVCFVVPTLEGGGAERVAVTVLNGLDPTRYCRALCLFRRIGPYLNDVDAGIDVHVASGDGRTGRVRNLAAFFRQWRPDVVVSFLSYFSVFAALKLSGTRGAFVINQQTPVSAFLDDRDFAWQSPMRRALFTTVARMIYPCADRVVATASGVRDDLVAHYGVSPGRVNVIANPFDLDAIASRAREPVNDAWFEGDAPLIVSAGRLADVKNYPLLMDALALLKGRGRRFKAVILGQGERETDIRRRIHERGLDEDVRLGGFQANPWRFMARARVFALTSRYEGFGNVIVEAMACGTPAVATASPGPREIVQDSVNGLLVERHEPEAMAAALERVLTDAPFREVLSRGARASAGAYALTPIMVAHDRLFGSLVA